MTISELMFPPAFIMIIGAMLLPVVRDSFRPVLLVLVPLLTLLMIWNLDDGVLLSARFLGYEVELVEASNVRRLFATIFALMAMIGGFFAFRHAKVAELSAAMAYAAGAVGVSFAGDLITLFLFWEFMALFSTIVVWCGGTEEARRAGIRYGIMHLIGGIILKIGIEGVAIQTGSIEIQALQLESFATWMILIGILINAAAPPVSAWLSDAYPEASPTGSVFLSAFTTKTAVLALWLLFPGQSVLIWIGLYMIFYGIIYALMENDMRRILAYSIVNQVGFMVVGVGIGTEMALNGVAAHAFSHIIYKALLLMSAGAVMVQTGKRKCTDLGGLYRTMPVTAVCGIIGALAISAFPYTSGFISKSMISSGAAYEQYAFVWYCLVAASAGVFLHAGIKFPWFVFFQKDSGLRPKDPSWNMQAAMIFFAAACVLIGVFPQILYDFLPFEATYEPYTADHLVTQLQLLLFAGLAFFVTLPLMKRTLTISLDVDFFYRRLGPILWRAFERLVKGLGDLLQALVVKPSKSIPAMLLRYHGPEGPLARTWPTGSMLLWVTVLLVVILIGARLL
ncbi:MAG: Na(+)/H(+) antiporter subunit D [Gammaproteobacteria bacterium]|nr:Na(+)/H(+) antiporter subunit D [Pseudohongiella sp.]MAY56933.1 Na(+)/H(+) antiporter subunit D [Gammaproteobacteria bacterium]MBJ53986.1 Na(+)/H(+) antiporter subunit D [Gammaproteobacteria bacterium]HBN14142.1 Na(+)/H(+) antiporter subunit D [Pseudohongiella sp.]|tara:strand:- start:20235 stop:21929 length:1695 start_codon:yes stop_codon:yes gene_type:complete